MQAGEIAVEQQLALFPGEGSSGAEGKVEGNDGEEEVSEFVEGTYIQWLWSASSIELFKRCPRLYQYVKIDGWESPCESVHITFGSHFHKALENYDRAKAAGIDHDDAVYDVIRDLVIDTADWNPDEKYKNKINLFRTVVWHLDHYNSGGDDPAQPMILQTGEPAVEINFKFDTGFEIEYHPESGGEPVHKTYMLQGYLDKVVEFQGEQFIMDYKTTTSTPGAYYFNQYEPNNQMTLYTLAGQVIFGTAIKGVIISAEQIGVEFSRSVRGLTYRTKDQLTEWLSDLKYWLGKAEDCAIEGHWPMNDTACDKYGGCAFREVCSKSPNVREVYLKSNFKKGEQWNPLKPR